MEAIKGFLEVLVEVLVLMVLPSLWIISTIL
jgi:hypothetical protein